MTFLCIRTSDYYNSEPPCSEAKYLGKDTYHTFYTVEFDSIENMMSFIKKYGDCVVRPNAYANTVRDYPTIEIYDDYRE